jgi:hypothetical protein
MLLKIEARKLSAHKIIRNHILSALSESVACAGSNKELMVQYLAYIMLHFQYACAICPF